VGYKYNPHQRSESLGDYHPGRKLWVQPPGLDLALKVTLLVGALFFFLISLRLLSSGLRFFGSEVANDLLQLSTNPFIGLFIGILATAMLQSSSTITTLIVLVVASGGLSLQHAVPLIMGANIGTAVTSTIVSLGHIANRREYELAIAAATVHDFFNIITALLLFVLETSTHALSQSAAYLGHLIPPQHGGEGFTFFLHDFTHNIVQAIGPYPFLILPLVILCLFGSLQFLVWILKTLIIGRIEHNLNRFLFGKPIAALTTGFVSTTAVQSSSATSSLIVPLVATGKVSLSQAFPFIMGANIGTTTTALFAAIFTEVAAPVALSVAFVHMLFNLFGVLILFPFVGIRRIPVRLAEMLSLLASRNRLYGIAYVVIVFFAIPFTLIFLYQW
jgi:solute carrier family 34 (sodium-dependent phosphate cotransporter)